MLGSEHVSRENLAEFRGDKVKNRAGSENYSPH